jgi:VIT1/CCC1 family predicted Fe2+/Mn2+ transporter
MFSRKQSRRAKTAAAVAGVVTAALPKKDKPSKKSRALKWGVGTAVASAVVGAFVKDKQDSRL